jgi:outer membrane protein TolC
MARENHPELRKLGLKGESLAVEQQLARENLKPRLDLGYYFLDEPFNSQGERTNLQLDDNYKIGVNMAFPIFLRKERAKLSQVRLKMLDNSFALDFTELQIINEINSQFATIQNLEILVDQQVEMVENYELILTAERLNLELGESDLFKINIQLEKLIESQVKLLKSQAMYQKDIATLYWAAGIAHLTL